MHSVVIRSFVAAAAFLFLASACDKVEEKKADAKKTEPAKTEEPAVEEPKPEEPKPEEPKPEELVPVDTAAGADAEPTATTGEVAADAGAAEGGEDKPADTKTDTKAATKPDTKPDTKAADPEPEAPKVDAKGIYMAKCKSCHGEDGKGETTIGKKVSIPSLVATKKSKSEVVGIINNGVDGTKMKGYADKLSKDEIDAVAAYVKKL